MKCPAHPSENGRFRDIEFQGSAASAETNSICTQERIRHSPYPDLRLVIISVRLARLTTHMKPFIAKTVEPNCNSFKLPLKR